MTTGVGATLFALEAAACLEEAGVFFGVFLYNRQEGQKTPTLHSAARSGMLCLCMEMRFSSSVHPADIRSVLSESAMELAHRAAVTAMGPPMLYYQTDKLLRQDSHHLPACVTHHGLCFGEFADQFSAGGTLQAFGSVEKALHIMRQKELGLAEFVAGRRIFLVQHSRMQCDSPVRQGVGPARIREGSAPIRPDRTRSVRPAADGGSWPSVSDSASAAGRRKGQGQRSPGARRHAPCGGVVSGSVGAGRRRSDCDRRRWQRLSVGHPAQC